MSMKTIRYFMQTSRRASNPNMGLAEHVENRHNTHNSLITRHPCPPNLIAQSTSTITLKVKSKQTRLTSYHQLSLLPFLLSHRNLLFWRLSAQYNRRFYKYSFFTTPYGACSLPPSYSLITFSHASLISCLLDLKSLSSSTNRHATVGRDLGAVRFPPLVVRTSPLSSFRIGSSFI